MTKYADCKTVDDFVDAENDLAVAKEEHLRRTGWTHTSSTPGHYWMWRRTIDGHDLLVDFTTAWRIQGTVEAGESPDG